jgi:hypothetical protein
VNRDDWNEKAKWMREVEAVEATFSPEGKLLSLKLAPVIPPADAEDKRDPHDELKELEARRRALAFASSGGLKRRREPA